MPSNKIIFLLLTLAGLALISIAQAQPAGETPASRQESITLSPLFPPAPASSAPTRSHATASLASANTASPSTEPISLIPPKPVIDIISNFADLLPIRAAIDDADLWNRIRVGFSLQPLDSPLVQEHEQWYASRPEYIRRFVERGSKYLHHVVEEVEKRGMPMEIALLPIIESAFNPQAYSRARAAGIWQFIPSTGKTFGLKQDWAIDHRRDVLASTHAALAYLQRLYGMFNSWELALAAYNCGEGCVGRAIANNEKKGLPTGFLHLNLPLETRHYVPKLIAVKNIILTPGSYGIELDTVPDQPYFTKVPAPARIDVKLAAELAGLKEEEFVALNPSFNKPVATGDLGYFLLPREKADVFHTNLANYQARNAPMVSWQTYNAKRGESFDAIGKRFGVSGAYLRSANPLVKEKRNKITTPVTIMVPLIKEAKVIRAAVNSASSPSSTKATVIDSTPVIAARSTRHVVEAGETLFSIAREKNITVDKIKTLNRLSGNTLRSGQILEIPMGNGLIKETTQTGPTNLQDRSIAKPTSKTYIVKNGDTLSGIADKFRISMATLIRTNHLAANTILQPGMRLIIPT